MLFLSTFENKIDVTGRVSVPATFRASLINSRYAGVILYPSFTAPCLEGLAYERMMELCEASDNLDVFSEKNESLNSLLFAESRQAPFDSAGRISITQDLLQMAQIKEVAMFVGKGKTFQIWNPKKFAEHQKKVRELAQKNRPTLKIWGGEGGK
jgi:MraZ protein